MFIEELILDGFKSYSTSTGVGPFDRQFNAITGLNGSGKSNILDAICFVLGISNLSQVRVGNLSELVYKQGQAGISKASVTVTFNNMDKARSPVGYELHDRIVITRQIIIGGRNKYLLNGHNVQQNQIQNLFHSVCLNVNNPHFLIMQGRITKVINMKPEETLGMIEEAAGTRMYENKKAGALRTLEKKQNKVDEINQLLSEEITPTLEKLQRERQNYMMWVSNNNEIERLTRFCIAFEYMQVKNRLENKNQQLEELEETLRQITHSIKTLTDRDDEIQKEIKERAAARDKHSSQALKKLEDQHTKCTKEVAVQESKLKNKESELKALLEGQQHSQTALGDLRRQTEQKEKAHQKEKGKLDAILAEEAAIQKNIEKAQWSMQALVAGMSAQAVEAGEAQAEANRSAREELLAAQTRLSEMEADQKKKQMGITSCKERMAAAQQILSRTKDGRQLAKEKGALESTILEKRKEMQKLKFDPAGFQQLQQFVRQSEAQLVQTEERLYQLRANLGGIDFNFADPWRGFDRSSVKGVVAKLFHIKPDFKEFHRALEVQAGGRLWFVVVDTEETGKALLEKGQLRKRVTIIPLNKIQDYSLPDQVVRQARNVMPQGGEVHTALEIIGFERQVQSAMKFVFGGSLVCDTPETAKKVTFHPNVRVRSVTKEGDVYDPAGTITGGSAPKGNSSVLIRLTELAELEEKVRQQKWELQEAQKKLQKDQEAAQWYQSLQRELDCKEHELKNMEERINHSEHHAAEHLMQQMQALMQQLEEEIKSLPEEKKRLEKLVKQMEKDIKNLDSNREDRIRFFEQQIIHSKAQLQQHADKLEKQREKTDQANVELEVIRNELQAQEGKEAASGQTSDTLAAEIEQMRTALEQKRADAEQLQQQIEGLRTELRNLDETVQKLSSELENNKRQREEKELEHKRMAHKIQQLQKDDKEAATGVARMEQEHAWIEQEKRFFGKAGTDFDFKANSYQDNKSKLDKLNQQQKNLGKNINKKAMAMFEKAEQEYKDLLQRRDQILEDKKKIEMVIKDLDEKKSETLRRTWKKVNKDFDSIFSTLLPHTNAKLEPPQGMDETQGLEIKVAFNDVWKQSLTELSGGQRSLLALSLVLALLLFKPAPMYILDEIDSALDLSHTQNIGHMIRTHFPHSQFIVVSLKEGMFNHANVLFRTRFMDGTSTVSRYAIRETGEQGAEEQEEPGRKRRKVA